MDKDKNLFCLRCRMLVAKKFNIPPDDVDIESIANCLERGLGKNTLILIPKNKQEKKAVCSFYGPFVIELMLDIIFSSYLDEFEEEEDDFFLDN